MASPVSIRFDDQVVERLASYVARHPGLTRSAAAARYVDEGLRMDEHPGVVFRDGPTGRRASLVGGPDVWEVVRSVRATRAAEPTVTGDALMALVEENTGVPRRVAGCALDYWAAYPDEVEAMVAHAERADNAHEMSAARLDALRSR